MQDDADEVDDAGEPMEAPEESLFESEDEAGDGQAEQDAIERAELDGEDARYIEGGADEEEQEQDDAVDATLLTADAPASGSAKRHIGLFRVNFSPIHFLVPKTLAYGAFTGTIGTTLKLFS